MKRGITDEESQEFRNSMKNVKPLKTEKRILPHSHLPKTKKINTDVDTTSEEDPFSDSDFLPTVNAETALNFSRSGLQHSVMRKLRQGLFPIDYELDLHGHTIIAARKTLANFLNHCVEKKYRYVVIVHGKGQRQSNTAPVLKNRINHWLREHPFVLAFCSAKPAHGGTGAVYVLLKRKAEA